MKIPKSEIQKYNMKILKLEKNHDHRRITH